MINDLVKQLKLIINYGILPNEKLTDNEKKERINKFYSELSLDNYLELFNQINMIIIDDSLNYEVRGFLAKSTIECIELFSKFNENIEKFPTKIQKIYNCYCNLHSFKLQIEFFLEKDVVVIKDIEKTLVNYVNFLENIDNELFINLYFDQIDVFNKRIIADFQELDYNGNPKEESINVDIVNIFKTKIDNLKRGNLN